MSGGMYEILHVIITHFAYEWFTTEEVKKLTDIGSSSVSACIARLKKLDLLESKRWREKENGNPRCAHRIIEEKRDFIKTLYEVKE